ncbi:nucleotide disphospho-sugar-binding domain-containing protein [Nocardioides nitrophenolicus]|uniref:nucleotide disphospho-sugar-binding domain-containing protein n=1 Tax=Nocardioides nitrophenolicus TaxID=60489 RepID=UPI001958440E|nr:nucleotide disphospho-sugar-binding domain-containing protein [Nocardioides nitrophenolicus]MBM7518427.1 UDP:flavonoid glycosyltransferase YjiC (YdhE family) [Nocardioides nitrophenolicus]
MRRVDLVAPPMAGHLHPILGIAARLAAEPGLEVRVISTAAALPAIAASGVSGLALLAGADEVIETVVDPPYRIGSSPRLLFRQFRAAVALQADFRRELLHAWAGRRPDLVIADFTMGAVGTAADEIGVPWWTTHPSPCAIEGRAGPPAYLGGWRPGRSAVGRGRDAAGRTWVRGFKRLAPRLAGVRLAEVGITRQYRADGSESIYSAERVFALTPEVMEYPRALPTAVRYVGPVLHTPPSAAPPPVLAPGRRAVLVTAGTHLPWHKTTLVSWAAAAARALPDVEVHVSLGGTGPVPDLPPGVVVHDYVDYARDLPRFAAVVHHGGAGVLGHTLAAGLPAVVWPVDYDQFDHAVRLVDAGVAVRLRRRDRPDALAAALRRVLDQPSYRLRARAVAADLARRPAVEAIAAEVRDRLLSRAARGRVPENPE